MATDSQSSTDTAGLFEFREFRENAFRDMEVQICGETRTVQFSTSDHGGDHPTSPAVAIDWAAAVDLANWILSRTVAQAAPEPDLWAAIRQRDANINAAFAGLNAIEAQLHEMRSLKGWRLNLIRENLEKTKAALRTPTSAAYTAKQPLQEALDLAVNIIMANEPGDSRAVSDEAVALAAVACGDASDGVMKVIRAALAMSSTKRET